MIDQYRPVEEYIQTVVAMTKFTTILLKYFPDDDKQTQELIIRNFIARGFTKHCPIMAPRAFSRLLDTSSSFT
jgi:hypothetical protein